jgi:hypothetical protein
MPFHLVFPRHELTDGWSAPFFMEDRRNIFYVTTQQQPSLIWDFLGYGIAVNPGISQASAIPPLVVQSGLLIPPKFWGDGGPIGPDPGIIDPAPIQRFVTEDAYIRQGIGTTGSVIYGERQIGPSGAIATVRAKM